MRRACERMRRCARWCHGSRLDMPELDFDAGVRQVWVIYPSSRLVYVHDALDKVRALNEADILDGGTILPGFQLKIGSIFPPRT